MSLEVELDKKDLVRMIKGTIPSHSIMPRLSKFGWHNGTHDSWDWNSCELSKMPEEKLWELYLLIRGT